MGHWKMGLRSGPSNWFICMLFNSRSSSWLIGQTEVFKQSEKQMPKSVPSGARPVTPVVTLDALWEHTVQGCARWPETNRAGTKWKNDRGLREFKIFLYTLWHNYWWRQKWSGISQQLKYGIEALKLHHKMILQCCFRAFNWCTIYMFSLLVKKDMFWVFCSVLGEV